MHRVEEVEVPIGSPATLQQSSSVSISTSCAAAGNVMVSSSKSWTAESSTVHAGGIVHWSARIRSRPSAAVGHCVGDRGSEIVHALATHEAVMALAMRTDGATTRGAWLFLRETGHFTGTNPVHRKLYYGFITWYVRTNERVQQYGNRIKNPRKRCRVCGRDGQRAAACNCVST